MHNFKTHFKESRGRVFYDVDNGKEYHWPEVKGWYIIDTDKTDRFGTAGAITMQDNQTGTIVDFDASALQQGGKGPGTYRFDYWGKTTKGTFKKVDNLKNVIRKIQAQLPGIKKKQIKLIPKSIKGFVADDFSSDVDLHYTQEFPGSLVASVTVFDIGEILAGGRGEVHANISSHSGYEQDHIWSNVYVANGLADLKKVFSMIIKDVTKAGVIR